MRPPGSKGGGRHASRTRHGDGGDRRALGPSREASDGSIHLWGIHAVEAALANEHRIVRQLYLTENAEQRLESHISARKAKVVRTSPRDLDRLVGPEAVHQGVVAQVEPLPESGLADLIATAEATGLPIVVLDQVTDPHNVGAILRSAAVFGTAGVIMTRRHSPPMAGVLAKSASGALELVPVALVGNLAQALAQLGEAGVTRIGLDGDGTHVIDDEPMSSPLALVLGAEGKGLRRLSRELCDRLCRIGSAGALASLNVSNAAAVALYTASLRRKPE